MYGVVGRVRVKPGQDALIRSVVTEQGSALLRSIPGAKQATWFRMFESDDQIQHALWLFGSRDEAERAKASFEALREMPDAPSEFVSSDVCEVVGHEVMGSTPSRPGAVMTQWEYGWAHTTSVGNVNKAMEKAMETAQQWGANCWEMVNCTASVEPFDSQGHVLWHVTVAFKRPKAG